MSLQTKKAVDTVVGDEGGGEGVKGQAMYVSYKK